MAKRSQPHCNCTDENYSIFTDPPSAEPVIYMGTKIHSESEQVTSPLNKRTRLDDSTILPIEFAENSESTQSSLSQLESANKELRLRLECAELKLEVEQMKAKLKEQFNKKHGECEKLKNEVKALKEGKSEKANKLEDAEQRISQLEKSLRTKELEWEEQQKILGDSLQAKEREVDRGQVELDKTRAELKEAKEEMHNKERICLMKHREIESQEAILKHFVRRKSNGMQQDIGKQMTKETKDELLLMAILYTRGDSFEKCVRELLQNGANANKVNESGETALHLAARRGIAPIVGLLLEHGALVNAKTQKVTIDNKILGSNEIGMTALHIALKYCNVDVVKLLVSRGANLEEEDGDGNKPIHYAAYFCSTEIVQFLLNKGARINEKRRNGQRTALHLAIEMQSIDVARLLISRGADMKSQDSQGDRPIHYAVEANSAEMVGLILDQSREFVNLIGDGFQTPLHVALEDAERIPIVKMLLERGANLEAQDNKGNRPLYYAVWLGNANIVQLLLDHKASVDAKNGPFGQTALHEAAASSIGDSEIVEMLVKRGANLEAEDNNKNRPLHIAVKENDPWVVDFLLKSGVNINCKNGDGCTPLHYSILFFNPTVQIEIVEKLLDYSLYNGGKTEIMALLNVKNKDGNTALDLARQLRRPKMVIKLLEKSNK